MAGTAAHQKGEDLRSAQEAVERRQTLQRAADLAVLGHKKRAREADDRYRAASQFLFCKHDNNLLFVII